VAKKKSERIYKYTCTLTGEKFTSRRRVDKPEELVSLHTYYQLNPEMDDRPEHVVKVAESERVERIEREEARLAAIAEMQREQEEE